ncbi:glycine zipper family protein [Gordonia paraffinivorans]|uniref:glycine zipper family protein n=1 Tax=Gordonia paraffinivorans TaxID=175628 RepID=UPI003FCE1144
MILDQQDGAWARTRTRTLVTVVFSLAAVAITALAGIAQAAPRPQSAAPTYDASWNASSLTLNLHNASATTDNGKLTIRDNSGKTLFQMPLLYRSEYLQFPIDVQNSGSRVTLIPSKNVARAVPVDPVEAENLRAIARHQVAAPETRQERDDQALERFNSQLRTGITVSSLIGTVVGGIIGGIVGCALGVPVAGIGCLAAIPLGTAAGALIGLTLGGGGTLIGAAIHYFQTINSPFVPPKK